ncbi:ferrichrome ABC transporter substrate-binding protein [Paenibacillus montaniterrae]|uniref:Ferrichrome ABC transporter substrate-binding protein n=1 Tax=Paenibacillus montaniterrae TaxID=429341 RepID=A0A920CZ63_9BACL|nr:ABC transporter substrate-binding protein [Paenibacillus montaniterrae]GIP17123.1 ferrichrome ABC transporter substrate-binding protein [Paenibacillus montaniterrae]
MKKSMYGMLLLIIIMLLAGCGGNTQNQATGGNNSSNSSNQAPANDTANNASDNEASQTNQAAQFPRTYNGAKGEVVIEQAPQKVAVVHWGYADSILLFDLPSLALVSPFGREHTAMESEAYKPYVDKLDDWTFVGENTEVDMEELLAYDPDLIIAGNQTNAAIIEQLDKIATTVVIDEEKVNVWSDWKPLVTAFGEILGQEDAAEKFIADFNAKVEETKQALANVEGTVAFLQVRNNAAWLQGSNYLTLYYEGLGLQPLEGELGTEGAQLSLEGLSELNPDHLVLGYFNMFDTSLAAITDEWESSSEVWKQLNAVKSEHVYRINGELALAYGPLSHTYGIEALGEAMVK